MEELVLRNLQLEKDFLFYLDEEDILIELEKAVIEYEKTVTVSLKMGSLIPPFRFILVLNLLKIQDISESLNQLFMKEPDTGINMAKNIIFHAITILSSVSLTKSECQITPKITNLPITIEISDLLRFPSYGLQAFEGILTAKTSIVKYVRSSTYRCILPSCPQSEWKRYPKNFGNICVECSSSMEEDVLSTDTGEEIICLFISLKAYHSLARFQGLKVKVKDELISSINLNIGEKYKILGRLDNNFFEALNIYAAETLEIDFLDSIHLNSSIFSNCIRNFFHKVSNDCPNSPWSFVSAISSLLSSKLIPTSTFLNLKIGLMLSLCTQKKDESPVHLVAIGSDFFHTQNLFQSAGQLSDKYVRLSTTHSYLGGAAKPAFQSDAVWQEAGQLILAAYGVCNLGDWSKFKKEQNNYICQTIESGHIVMNKEFSETNSINIVPLKCSIWTYCSHITSSRNDQTQLKRLVNIFGIPFLAEEKKESEIKKLCWRQLKTGMRNFESLSQNEIIPLEDLKHFITLINMREPTFTNEASQLIRNYFVASRRERPHCLPVGAVKTISSLAEAHARLALREEVLYEDVIMILYLYEESISTLFGKSMNPYQQLIWEEKEPIFDFMGKQLHHFRIWMEEYFLI